MSKSTHLELLLSSIDDFERSMQSQDALSELTLFQKNKLAALPNALAIEGIFLRRLEQSTVGNARITLDAARNELLRLITPQTETAKTKSPLVLPPGVWLTRVSRFLLTPQAHQRYVQPAIADMQHEYCQAVHAGDDWHARWIAIRGHMLVLRPWLWAALTRALKSMFSSP